MVKLILSLIIIISATMLGNSFAVRLSTRRNTLTHIVSAISRIKTLICFGTFETQRVVEDCLCSEDFPLLKPSELSGTSEYRIAFSKSVDKISDRFSLTKADKLLLKQFGDELGTTDVSGQVAHAELYSDLFKDRLESVKKQESEKARLYRILGFSLGAMISLLIV